MKNKEVLLDEWSNGNLRYEIPIMNKNKLADGVVKWWHKDRSIDQLVQYKKNIIHGVDLLFKY